MYMQGGTYNYDYDMTSTYNKSYNKKYKNKFSVFVNFRGL